MSLDDPDSPPRIFGDVRSYSDLHRMLRARVEEIGAPMTDIDAVSGVQSGYSAKILAPLGGARDGRKRAGRRNAKRLSFDFQGFILPTIGLKLVLVEDPDAAKYVARLSKKNSSLARTTADQPRPKLPMSRPGLIAFSSRGGKVAMQRKSEAERIEFGRIGGLASAAKLTARQRRQKARKAATSRWSRRLAHGAVGEHCGKLNLVRTAL
jgi:hypothetical protein